VCSREAGQGNGFAELNLHMDASPKNLPFDLVTARCWIIFCVDPEYMKPSEVKGCWDRRNDESLLEAKGSRGSSAVECILSSSLEV